MLGLIRRGENTPDCPIIIDSPNQQDQDDVNHALMLEFIRDHRPNNTQLLLCLVDDCGMDFGGSVLMLQDKDYVLRQEDYVQDFPLGDRLISRVRYHPEGVPAEP
jgi:hypothetical protein